MSKQCDECKKDICDCRLSVKHYNRGYKHGMEDGIDELADMLTNDWGLDIILSQTNRKDLKAFINSNADQIKEEKNE